MDYFRSKNNKSTFVSSGAVAYRVKLLTNDDVIFLDTNLTETTMAAEGLSPGEKYNVHVASIDQYQRQSDGWNSSVFFVTSNTLCGRRLQICL